MLPEAVLGLPGPAPLARNSMTACLEDGDPSSLLQGALCPGFHFFHVLWYGCWGCERSLSLWGMGMFLLLLCTSGVGFFVFPFLLAPWCP